MNQKLSDAGCASCGDGPKYRYADEVTEGNVPIQIVDGEYKGLMVRYNRILLEEKDEDLYIDYDYEFVRNPDNLEMTDELRDVLTSVIVSVLNEQITEMPDDMDLLKEGNSEEHRKSDTPESSVQ